MEGKRNSSSLYIPSKEQTCALAGEQPAKIRKINDTKVNPIMIGQVNSQDIKIDYNAVELVTVPRDLLLTFTRQDLDNFIQQVTQGRKLTKEQRQEVSRQRKLIKNRKSAAASRKRKKEQLGTLEEHHAELSEKNSKFREKFAALKSTNLSMKDELNFLKSLVHSNPGISYFLRNIQNARKQYENASVAMKQAATILLIIILSLNIVISSGFLSANNFEKMNYPTKNTPILLSKPEPISPQVPPTYSILDSMSSTHDQNGNYVPTLLPEGPPAPLRSLSSSWDRLSNGIPVNSTPADLSPSANPNYKEDLSEIFPGLFDDAEIELLGSSYVEGTNTTTTPATSMDVEITGTMEQNVIDPLTMLLLDLVHTPHSTQCEFNPSLPLN